MTNPQLRTGEGARQASLIFALVVATLVVIATLLGMPWWSSPLAILAFFGAILCHELAHALTATVRGLHWTAMILGAPGGGLVAVEITDPDGKPRTNLDQLLISLSGPLAEITCGTLVLATANLVPSATLLVGMAGLCSIYDGALQLLLVPIKMGDGHKAAKAAWQCLQGRAHHPWS